MQEHSSQSQPLRLTAGKRVGECIAFEVQVHDVQAFGRRPAALGTANPIRGRKELEVLDHLHIVVDAEKVGHVTHQAANLFGFGVDRIPAHVRLAPSRIQQGGDDAHGGCLASAIGTDETKQVALVQFQVDRADGIEIAVSFREVFRFNQVLATWLSHILADGLSYESSPARATGNTTLQYVNRWPLLSVWGFPSSATAETPRATLPNNTARFVLIKSLISRLPSNRCSSSVYPERPPAAS